MTGEPSRRKRGRPPHPDILTPREWQVLTLIRHGLTNESIALRLDVSVATAKYHVSEILSKLGVTTREDAATWQPEAAPVRWWQRAVAPLSAIVRRFGHPTLTKAAIAAGTLAALAGLAVLVWAISDRDEEHQVVAHISSPTETATSVASRSTVPTPSPAPVEPDLGDLAFAFVALDGTVWLATDEGLRQVISESLFAGPDFAAAASNVKWSPDGRRLAYREPSLPQGSLPAGTALWVVDPLSSDRIHVDDSVVDFEWMRNGERIYYQRSPSESWVADMHSGGKAKIGDNRVFWSHDEGRFVFTGRIGEYDPARPSESVALFLSSADGVPAQRLVDWAGASDWLDPWSPDDRLLAYYKGGHGGSSIVGDICMWDLLTSKETCLREFSSDEFPDWAPLTGRYIFHNYEIDPAGGTFRELFPRPAVLTGWSPDATKVAYVERNPLGQGSQSLIMLDSLVGTSLVLHTSARTAGVHDPGYWARWSPDGRFLALIGRDDAIAATLYVADAITGEILRVRAGFDVGELFFAFAPDSSRLLIQDGRYESPSIWIADANGLNMIKVTDGYAVGHGPDFAPWRP